MVIDQCSNCLNYLRYGIKENCSLFFTSVLDDHTALQFCADFHSDYRYNYFVLKLRILEIVFDVK